jgi:hypothetical protein
MQHWYDQGYFPLDLLVKRTHADKDWIPIGELARRIDRGKIFSSLQSPTSSSGNEGKSSFFKLLFCSKPADIDLKCE